MILNIFRRQFSILIFTILFTQVILSQENVEYELIDIEFVGNSKISSSELYDVISSRESPGWFSQFLNKYTSFGEEATYFDSLLIPQDINSLISYYYDQGFFKVKVSSGFILRQDEKEAQLFYYIDEGIPSHFASFKLLGIENIHRDFKAYLYSLVDVDTTQQYSRNIVDNVNSEIISYLRNRGLMFVDTEIPFVEIDTVKNIVDVQIKVNTGERYKISNIRVSKAGPGKDLVSDDLLKEIVNIDTGSYYNYYYLQRGQTRLYRTNLFTSAIVAGITADTLNKYVPINVSVDVGLLNEFAPEIILNNEDNQFNLGLGLGYIRKNFLGDARKFTIKTSAASQNILEFLSHPTLSDTTVIGYADLRTIFEQPFLLGQPIYTKLENYATIQKRKNEYNATLLGSKLSFDFELPPQVYLTGLSTSINWERSKYFYQESYLINILGKIIHRQYDVDQNFADSLAYFIVTDPEINYPKKSQSTNAVLAVELLANKTNDFIFPSKGYSIEVTLSDGNGMASLVSRAFGATLDSPKFYKILLNSSAYLPFYYSKESSFGIKFMIGNIHTYEGNKNRIPLNQRFISGGSNSLRGWKSRELIPQDVEFDPLALTPEEYQSLSVEQGIAGFFIVEGSIESRNRLIDKIGSALFIDFGNTFLAPSSFQFDKLAVAAGFGFRYYSDIVPIRVDFGFKIYDPQDPRSFFNKLNDTNVLGKHFSFHLGIGEAF